MEQTNPKEEWKYRRQDMINEWIEKNKEENNKDTL